MELLLKRHEPLQDGNQARTARDADRERRVALALLVRRHMIEYSGDIRSAYMATVDPAMRPARGVKVSTALAKLIGLPAYHNVNKGKPEPAKHLLDFVQSAGPAHYAKILEYFREHVITPHYRAMAPAYIQMAIYEVFDTPCADGADAWSVQTANGHIPIDAHLKQRQERARYAPQSVIAAIEETVPQLIARAKLFAGTWNIIRYAHHGKRVVRLVMEVTCHEDGRLTFKLYFRTRGMTLANSKDKYVTRGSLIVLKGGQHVMFLGQEETHEGLMEPDGYPITITCPTRISRDGPFMGLVQRRHDDGKIFAIKAQFVRAARSIDEIFAAGRVGSFETDAEIARMAKDIPGFDGLLAELRRSPDDVTGGLVL